MRSYALAADLHRQGGVYLRPWHLVCSSESGVKGFVEEDSWLKAVLWMFHFRTAMLGFWSDFGFFCRAKDLHLQLAQLVLAHGYLQQYNVVLPMCETACSLLH